MSDQHKPLTVAEKVINEGMAADPRRQKYFCAFMEALTSCKLHDKGDIAKVMAHMMSERAQAQHEAGVLSRIIDAIGYEGHIDAMPERIAALLTKPMDAELRAAVENLGRFVTDLEGCTSFQAGKSVVAMIERDIRTLLRAVQAQRLTGEQIEAVKEADAALELNQCFCADGYVCTRCKGRAAIRAAFRSVFGKEG